MKDIKLYIADKICDDEFRKAIRNSLKAAIVAKVPNRIRGLNGYLDQAVAAGFGFRNLPALTQLKSEISGRDSLVTISDLMFNNRLTEMGAPIDGLQFTLAVLNQLGARQALMKLEGMPTEQELYELALEYESFEKAFNEHLSINHRQIANVIIFEDQIWIGGWSIPLGHQQNWFVLQ